MRRAVSVSLWVAAGVLLVAAVALYLVRPGGSAGHGVGGQEPQLNSTIARAAAYYEFGHYTQAADTYRLAVERGMSDGTDWYRYAHAHELAYGLDLTLYIAAYGRLLEQMPDDEHVVEIEALLEEHATQFVYEDALAGRYAEGALLRMTATVSSVIWGRVESGLDTYVMATREHRWVGHLGDDVLVRLPRERRFLSGDTLSILGTYDGLCQRPGERNPTRTFPCMTAIGSRITGAP